MNRTTSPLLKEIKIGDYIIIPGVIKKHNVEIRRLPKIKIKLEPEDA